MHTSRRKFITAVPSVVAGFSLATTQTQALAFDGKPIRFVVPFPPGGALDAVGRRLADELRVTWNATIVVENKPGGLGVTGAMATKGAPPDGRTIFIGYAGTHAANVSLLKNLPYDPVADFTPIGLIADTPLTIMINSAVPARNLHEFIAYAKANPGKLNFGSLGTGVPSHLALELFQQRTGTSMTHVPYKGLPQLMPDLLSGTINGYFAPPLGLVPFIKNGQLRALAMLTEKRMKGLEEIPTAQEAGLPDFIQTSWFGMLAAGKIPDDLRDRMSRDLLAITRSPSYAQWCEERLFRPRTSTGPEFARFMAAETELLRKVITTAKITVD